MTNQITDKRFFVAGKALFTVHNPQGEHYTYKIRQGKGQWMNFFSVFLLTGPDNNSSYTYIGTLKNFQVVPTNKSKMSPDSKPFKVFNWAVNLVKENQPLPAGYGIIHEGKCCRCGRTLTTPESINQGYGPDCSQYFI